MIEMIENDRKLPKRTKIAKMTAIDRIDLNILVMSHN